MDMNDIKITKMKVNKDDSIIVTITKPMRAVDAKNCYDVVKGMYPNNVVIAIPDSVQLRSMRKADVINQLEMLLNEIKKGD